MDDRDTNYDAAWHDRYDTVYEECRALGEDPTWADRHATQDATDAQVYARAQQAGADAQTAYTEAVAASQQARAEIAAARQQQDQAAQAAIDETNALHWRLWYGLDDDDDNLDTMEPPQPEPNGGTVEMARGDRSQPAAVTGYHGGERRQRATAP